MRRMVLVLMMCLCCTVCRATRYWVGASTDKWNLSANWASSSGGAGGAGIPTATDSVVFDGNSNARSCQTFSSGMVCKALTVTSGFTQTFQVNTTLFVSGSVTFGAGSWTLSGSSSLTMNGSGTLTTNGRTVPFTMTFAAAVIALADNLVCSANISFSGSTSVTMSGAFAMSCVGFSNVTTSATVTLSGNVSASGLVTLGGIGQVLNGLLLWGAEGCRMRVVITARALRIL